jgi:serine/threonine protein kinase
MEYVPGGDLKQRIQEGISPDQALTILRQVASALGYAHQKGFVHRDVKPENILFREDGTAVLTDFGIAKAVGSGTRMTATGMAIGTAQYMSPEQALGQQVDGSSDLYSLGVVFYEMLTGQVPYQATDSFAVAYKHINDPVPQLNGALAVFQPLVDQLLAKCSGDRCPDTAELNRIIDALEGSNDPLPYSQTTIPTNHNSQATVIRPQYVESVDCHVVKGALLNGRYLDNGDGTVIDEYTGLHWMRFSLGQQWQGESIAGVPEEHLWESAFDAAARCTFAGYADWRLPTKEELLSIVEEGGKPTINPIAFPATPASWYWTSSTTFQGDVWLVYFHFGSSGRGAAGLEYYVRLVRGGKP